MLGLIFGRVLGSLIPFKTIGIILVAGGAVFGGFYYVSKLQDQLHVAMAKLASEQVMRQAAEQSNDMLRDTIAETQERLVELENANDISNGLWDDIQQKGEGLVQVHPDKLYNKEKTNADAQSAVDRLNEWNADVNRMLERATRR